MLIALFLIAATALPTTAQATTQELVDPFVNPVKIKIKRAEEEMKLKEKLIKAKVALATLPEKVKLFKPKIPKPLNEMKIEGVIGTGNKLLLVVVDPGTGETYLLKEGDPVAPDEKIARITFNRVVVYRYKRIAGRIVKETVILNVDTEGFSNG